MSTGAELGLLATSAPRTDRDGGSVPDGSTELIRVFMMDLWCYTPHYDRYLCQALAGENIEARLGAVRPYQDPGYFARNGIRNHPGFLDVVPGLGIVSDAARRILMLIESCLNMAALLARFRFSRPDIVHVQWIPLARKLPFEMWFLRLVKRLGIKLVYTVHNVLPHDTGRKLVPVFKQVYREMDGLICHTQEAKRSLVDEFSVDPKRVWIIPHGPLLHDAKRRSVQSAKTELPVPRGTTLVLWQGIIRSYKGLDFLLEAWSRIDATGLGACLLIAGTGESKLVEAIKEQVSRLGVEESVCLDLRFVPDVELPTYYQAADVMVYPYKEVTTSGALMTALAYRKAIVATALPAFQEVLKDGETARLVNYGDIDGLAQALTRLICEPNERQRLASAVAASENSDNSWSHIARKTRQCYAAVLGHARQVAA